MERGRRLVMKLYLTEVLVIGAGWGYIASSLVGQFVGVSPLPGTRFFWMIVPLTIAVVIRQILTRSN